MRSWRSIRKCAQFFARVVDYADENPEVGAPSDRHGLLIVVDDSGIVQSRKVVVTEREQEALSISIGRGLVLTVREDRGQFGRRRRVGEILEDPDDQSAASIGEQCVYTAFRERRGGVFFHVIHYHDRTDTTINGCDAPPLF